MRTLDAKERRVLEACDRHETLLESEGVMPAIDRLEADRRITVIRMSRSILGLKMTHDGRKALDVARKADSMGLPL